MRDPNTSSQIPSSLPKTRESRLEERKDSSHPVAPAIPRMCPWNPSHECRECSQSVQQAPTPTEANLTMADFCPTPTPHFPARSRVLSPRQLAPAELTTLASAYIRKQSPRRLSGPADCRGWPTAHAFTDIHSHASTFDCSHPRSHAGPLPSTRNTAIHSSRTNRKHTQLQPAPTTSETQRLSASLTTGRYHTPIRTSTGDR